MGYIVFIFLFLTVMTIITSIFLKGAIEEKKDSSLVLQALDFVTGIIGNIPVVGQFWAMVTTVYTFVYIHPYLAMIYGAIIAPPLGYLILRLVRGGG